MLSISQLQDLLHTAGVSNHDRLLLCLARHPDSALAVSQITEIASLAGWRASNVSSYLARASGLAIRTPRGWQLTTAGKTYVMTLAGKALKAPAPQVIQSLRTHSKKLTNANARAFVEEAVTCAEYKLYRSAVVLSWVGAVAVLYDHVVANKLAAFNAAAKARIAKWQPATTVDELAEMREFTFLQVLQDCAVIGKSVREELEACLRFRNGCGHPNTLQLAESRVVAHVETLLLNVYERF